MKNITMKKIISIVILVCVFTGALLIYRSQNRERPIQIQYVTSEYSFDSNEYVIQVKFPTKNKNEMTFQTYYSNQIDVWNTQDMKHFTVNDYDVTVKIITSDVIHIILMDQDGKTLDEMDFDIPETLQDTHVTSWDMEETLSVGQTHDLLAITKAGPDVVQSGTSVRPLEHYDEGYVLSLTIE